MPQQASFEQWKNRYDNNQLEEFNTNDLALLWLKIKSISRKEILDNFLLLNNINLTSKKLNDKFKELYQLFSENLNAAHKTLDDFIRAENSKQFSSLDIDGLVSQLYKLRHFDWGGDYKNQLDKYLVDKFIKVFSDYDVLVSKFDSDINKAVQGYVLCSWYNHWSSILIEFIFKQHNSVLPTVGQIKKVDFFIKDIPFDLKVTYLPANFIEKKRRQKGLKSELSYLKQQAKLCSISFNIHSRSDDIYYEIVEKLKDKDDEDCLESLNHLFETRLAILEEAQKNPKELIQNLYEEQGELRFDASNRLFLVLVDKNDFDNSWKLKRNLDLLRPNINHYLDNFYTKNKDDLKIEFSYSGKGSFTALSDIIFVIKEII
jgi:hypothetical protein